MREKVGRRRFELRPDVLALLRASGLLRIFAAAFSNLTASSLRTSSLFGGRNGPAQIRTTPRRARFAARVWSTSNLLGSIFPALRTPRSARRREMREKWAGADSNCGYGHPKAEGYQATPPARNWAKGTPGYNSCFVRSSGFSANDSHAVRRDHDGRRPVRPDELADSSRRTVTATGRHSSTRRRGGRTTRRQNGGCDWVPTQPHDGSGLQRERLTAIVIR